MGGSDQQNSKGLKWPAQRWVRARAKRNPCAEESWASEQNLRTSVAIRPEKARRIDGTGSALSVFDVTAGLRNQAPLNSITIKKQIMRLPNTSLAAMAAALLLTLTGGIATAQERDRDRGGFDPEQMRARMMERYREALEVKNDDEWKVIEPRISKVSDARRDMMSGGAFGRGSFGGRRGGPGESNSNGDDRRRRGFGGETNPDADALQRALEAKAPNEEIKTKLAKYRESLKQKQAALTAAQDDLRKVLSVRQEATAVMMGLLQ
jgi:hypothetical protein